ncbi:MAG TPA: hypothetical protein VGV59_11480 [Pyrinomonadaceae bacterium]|nr:hypothetical protein [Pyrinomonadaceae bacterium]
MAQVGNQAATQVLKKPHAEQKVEVFLEEATGVEAVAIKYSTWTEGLGWCGQKTIRLDASQLDELHHAIAVARQRLRRRRDAAGQPSEPAQVIQLPRLS